MKIMFIILLFSFAALAGAAFAIARHIRKGPPATPAESPDANHSHALEARLSGLSRQAVETTAHDRERVRPATAEHR